MSSPRFSWRNRFLRRKSDRALSVKRPPRRESTWKQTLDRRLSGANWRLFGVRCVVFITVSIFVLKFDPFGFQSATEELSQTLMLRVMSPTYEFGSFETGSLTPESAVVIWTDKTVQAAGGAWPVEYRKHADVIAGILAAGPSALFVDFKFLGRRLYDCTFTAMMDRIGAALFDRAVADPTNWFINGDPAPIFVASSFSTNKQLLWEAPLVEDCDDPATLSRAESNPLDFEPSIFGGPLGYLKPEFQKIVTGWRSPRSQYPLILAEKHVVPASEDQTNKGMVDEFSPALAMYLNGKGVDLADFREDPDSPIAARIKNDFQRPLFSQWPLTINNAQKDFSDIDSCEPKPSVIGLVWDELLRAFDDKPFDEPVQTCPPVLQINAERFFAGAGIIEQEDAEIIASSLNGRVVFYGADITDAPDLVLSPAHGQIAGVFSHAVAYENLRRDGKDYLAANETFQRFTEISLAVMTSIGFALYIVLTGGPSAAANEREATNAQAYFRRLLKKLPTAARVGLLIILVLSLLFLLAVVFFIFDLAIIDFVGLSTIAVVVLKLVDSYFLKVIYYTAALLCTLGPVLVIQKMWRRLVHRLYGEMVQRQFDKVATIFLKIHIHEQRRTARLRKRSGIARPRIFQRNKIRL